MEEFGYIDPQIGSKEGLLQGGGGDQDKKVAHVTQEFSTVARNQFLAPPRSLNSFGAEFV